MAQLFTHGYAVIIGVGADLPVTVDDATAVADLLRAPTRCAYPPEQVQLLVGKQARRAHILAALDKLATQTKNDPDATAVVYFSGHGIKTPDFNLMPFGYDLRNLDSTTITGRLFTEKLRAIQTSKLLVLLDCCHAGGQADAKIATLPKAPLPTDVLTEFKRSSGRVIIASSRQDEKSYTGKPYSVFTTALLEGLAGYGAFEKDGYARVLDLALYVGRMVPNRMKDKQHPILKVANLEDNFALAYYAAGSRHPKRLPYNEPNSTSILISRETSLQTRQLATWRRMLDNRIEAYWLMEERSSEFVEYQNVPLQLIRNLRRTKEQIADLREKLGLPEVVK